ncbi:hypothetical protein NB231_16953 [Nitrococcus mobilis Nb-231]|uniref:Uncharacterized protein n=1 Tax=Nitrococcus mobilis Nb-231 TaxID=314278 RepID=A4BMJ1_9GAMM|nr:hypothetical protein NB231_16953 [Nitrococcus mobilis Nb-231]
MLSFIGEMTMASGYLSITSPGLF